MCGRLEADGAGASAMSWRRELSAAKGAPIWTGEARSNRAVPAFPRWCCLAVRLRRGLVVGAGDAPCLG